MSIKPHVYAFVPSGHIGTRFRLVRIDAKGNTERVASVDMSSVKSERDQHIAELLEALNFAANHAEGQQEKKP